MNKMKIVAFGFFFAMVVILYGCSKEKRDWNGACETDSVESYESFIQVYPTSQHLKDAKLRITELTWEDTKRSRDISKVLSFMKDFPDAMNIDEAKVFYEDLFWEEVKGNSSKSSGFKDYLIEFPNGRYVGEAKILFDISLWNEAERLGTKEAYRKYIADSNEGKHVVEATQKVIDLETEEDFKSFKDRLRDFINGDKESNTIKSICGFEFVEKKYKPYNGIIVMAGSTMVDTYGGSEKVGIYYVAGRGNSAAKIIDYSADIGSEVEFINGHIYVYENDIWQRKEQQ